MSGAIIKSFSETEDRRPMPHGEGEYLQLEELTVARMRLDPGWRWSEDVKPVVGTESCMVEHKACVLAGILHVAMNDGQEFELQAGDVARIPPGHEEWVIGPETCVLIDYESEGQPAPAQQAERPENEVTEVRDLEAPSIA